MDNCGSYDRLIPLLSNDIAFLTFDLPGHGTSSRYGRGIIYSYYEIVLLIERIRKAHNWSKLSLMGHSLGSMCCTIYAAIFPDNIDLIISLDNFFPKDTDMVAKMRENMKNVLLEDDRRMNDEDLEPPSYYYEQLIDRIVRGSQFSVDRENAKYLLTRCVKKCAKHPEKYYFNYDRRIKGLACPARHPDDLLLMAKNISCPVLALFGRDSYMRKQSADNVPEPESIAEIKSNFHYHFGPGNHHFLLTHPEAYSEYINEFLRKYRPAMGKL